MYLSYVYSAPYSVTSDLSNIFSKYLWNLRDEKYRIEDSIRSWYDSIYVEIKKHFDNQLAAVHNHFLELENKIKTITDEYSKSAREWNYQNDQRSIEELLEKCRMLTFSMGEVSFVERKCSFIEYLPMKPMIHESDTKIVPSTRNSTENDRFTSETRIHLSTLSNSRSEKEIHSTTENRSSITIQKDHDDNEPQKSISTASKSSSINSPDAKSIDPIDNTLFECCPICYMLFPRNLSELDRKNHRSAHF